MRKTARTVLFILSLPVLLWCGYLFLFLIVVSGIFLTIEGYLVGFQHSCRLLNGQEFSVERINSLPADGFFLNFPLKGREVKQVSETDLNVFLTNTARMAQTRIKPYTEGTLFAYIGDLHVDWLACVIAVDEKTQKMKTHTYLFID
jgi:hypothetical protein